MGGCENLVLCSWVLSSCKKLTRLDALPIRDPICRFDVIWQRGEQLKSKLRMQHITLSALLSMDGEDQSNDSAASVCFPSSLLFEDKQASDLLSTQSGSLANFRVLWKIGLPLWLVCGHRRGRGNTHKPVTRPVQTFAQPWNLLNFYSEWMTNQKPVPLPQYRQFKYWPKQL